MKTERKLHERLSRPVVDAILKDDTMTLGERRNTLLRIAQVTHTQLAQELEVSRQAVGQVVAGDVRADRIERAVCRALGIEHRRLFPEHRDA